MTKRPHPDPPSRDERVSENISAFIKPATKEPTEFDEWVSSLEKRHLADLRFPEVTRALRALSATYVQQRQRLESGAALSGAGKRAAFALFYGPLHYLLVREIAAHLPGAAGRFETIVDLGCGTGAAGAGWAAACREPALLFGVDRHPWAVTEAARTYRDLKLQGRARVGDIARDPLAPGAAYLAAFTLNELPDDVRRSLWQRLSDRAQRGQPVLVVEPLAKGAAPWWRRETAPLVQAGARVDEWRFRVPLPAILQKLDTAAGLNHQEITGRSLWMPGAGS
jgi:SAM-dependent methyltransferase